MAEIINLRRMRKAKARDEAAKLAEQRRAAFGRSKSEKLETSAKAMLEGARLDGHKRDKDD